MSVPEYANREEHIYPVPNIVLSNYLGYEFLGSLAYELAVIGNGKIVLDFSDCTWFDANLCAALGCILVDVKQRNDVYFRSLRDNLKELFERNGFLSAFSAMDVSSESTTIPYYRLTLEDEQNAFDFMSRELFDKPMMPRMSDIARKKVLVSLFEICVNAVTHGGCEFVYVCGQMYPKRNPPQVKVTFADLGLTIKSNVNNFKGEDYTGNKSILWALEEGNSTKSGPDSGGIGLNVLLELVRANEGIVQIVSADGFVEMRNGTFIENEYRAAFPGTLVTVTLMLNDNKFYVAKEEIDLNSIF